MLYDLIRTTDRFVENFRSLLDAAKASIKNNKDPSKFIFYQDIIEYTKSNSNPYKEGEYTQLKVFIRYSPATGVVTEYAISGDLGVMAPETASQRATVYKIMNQMFSDEKCEGFSYREQDFMFNGDQTNRIRNIREYFSPGGNTALDSFMKVSIWTKYLKSHKKSGITIYRQNEHKGVNIFLRHWSDDVMDTENKIIEQKKKNYDDSLTQYREDIRREAQLKADSGGKAAQGF